ncbi:hypothetical protein BC567DRAFT_263709 [Phyllosticta citribraziliensis]
MVGCMPKKDSGVVRNVGAGFVMAQQPAELTTMTQSHPYAGRNTTTTTPAATSPLGVPRTPSPNRPARAIAPSPSPQGPRGRRRARSPSPSPERSKRVKTEGATPSPAAPNAAAAIPPPPPSTSSPSVYLRPASESTPPATFSFVAAPPAAQPQPQPKPAAPPAAPVKPKSTFSDLLDLAKNAPPPEKPRAFPDGNIPGFQKPVRMNEAPARSSAPFELLPSRIPGLGKLAVAVAAAPTTPSPAVPPPPPSSPPKDEEIDCARPLQVNPADFFSQAALPACLTPPQQQQPLFRRPSTTPPPPPPQPVQQHPLFSALPQQPQQQSVLRPLQQQPQRSVFDCLQQQKPQQPVVFPSFGELQQQRAARSPSPSDDEDEEIADAQPLAYPFARPQPPQDDEELCDAPSEEEPSADADVVIEDAPADVEAPFSVDAGELLDADSEKDDEDLPDAEPTQGPNVDYEELPDAAPDANPDVNVNVNTLAPPTYLAPPTSPKAQTLANLSPCSLAQIRGHFLKKSRSNPNRMGSPKPTSPTGPKTPTTPIRPLSPTDSATRPLSPETSSNRSLSPTSEPAARSARTRRGTAHRNGKQRAAQAKRREKREEYETTERLRTEKEEENERRIADLEAENARLKTDQARTSEKFAALEAQLAEANDLTTSAAKARDEAQSNADELNKKLTREVAADEATKQALANVNAELDSANDTIKVLKSDKDQLDEHIICMESDHAFEIDSRDSLAEEWEKNLNQLEQRAQTAEAALESARLYINNEATSSEVLQQELDATKSELEQEKLKAKDLQTELDQQQTELDQQKSKSESLTRNFRFMLDTQTAKVMKLTDANAKLTADNSQIQQNVDTEVAHSRQLEQRHEELRSLNLKLQKDLKNNAGRTRMPTQQEAGPSSNFSYGRAQRALSSTKTTSSNITNELSGASDEMELEMSTAARANRSKDITIKKLTAQLADFEARYDALKAVLADYEAAPTPSSPLPAALSSTALSIMPSSEAPELDSEDAAPESLQLTSAQPSSSAAPSTESSPKPTESTGTQTEVVCSVKLAPVNQSSSGALTSVSSPEPAESTLVTALAQPSSSTAFPTKSAQEMLREFEELLLKGRDEVNSRVDRIDGGIDALEASMKRSRTPACISCIGKSVSSIFSQPLLFFMLLLFFFLLTSVAIGHSMQEELWHEANTLSQDISFSPARTQIAGYGQVAVLVLFIINWWRS